jgi:hypothetical protein
MGVAGERLAEPGRADTGVFVGEGIPVLPVFPQLSRLNEFLFQSCPHHLRVFNPAQIQSCPRH